jgi:hypothetical protein
MQGTGLFKKYPGGSRSVLTFSGRFDEVMMLCLCEMNIVFGSFIDIYCLALC